ncbi:MAG TPA: PKD domain-containing protein [Kofleriaceae bacterium]
MRVARTCAVGLVVGGLVACAGETGGDEELSETAQAVSIQNGAVVSAVESSTNPLGGFPIIGIEPVTLTVFDLDVVAQAKWTAAFTTNLSWDGDKVRQGQTLDVQRSGSSIGVLKVLWTITGQLRPLGLFEINLPPIPLDVDLAGCAPPLDGSAFSCSADSPHLTLFDGLLPTTPFVRIAIGVEVTGEGAAAQTTRTLFFGDEQGPQGELEVTPETLGDANPMPCSKPVGTTVDYALDPFSYTPVNVTARQQPKFIIGFHDPFFSIPITLFEAPFGPVIETTPDFTLEGAGNTVALGELLANNVLPTIAPLGPFSGQEGAPVTFSQSTTSACPVTSFVWQFSDGTTSFGPHPQRSFGDDAVFNGQLTVTDSTSLSATGSFEVTITNRPPVANAGPNTSGAWGTQIALNGQAVDPGSDDQATLSYEWDFGDGTPGAGSAATSHAYTAPGDYVATLTVCDDHVCDTDTTAVHVRRRTVAVAYTGSNVGTFSAPATLMGSIVDELGQPVVGGTLEFSLAGAGAGSAQTNAGGNAARTVDVGIAAGAYAVGVSYGGSGLYEGGNTGEVFNVAHMASALQYTGALSGGSNKTVSLSAKLVDGLNRPLAGKTIVFNLGAQTTAAQTAANGIASVALKLNQKGGTYPLTAAWDPAGGEAALWTGSSASATFTLGGNGGK